jgi:hypothetical protein
MEAIKLENGGRENNLLVTLSPIPQKEQETVHVTINRITFTEVPHTLYFWQKMIAGLLFLSYINTFIIQRQCPSGNMDYTQRCLQYRI